MKSEVGENTSCNKNLLNNENNDSTNLYNNPFTISLVTIDAKPDMKIVVAILKVFFLFTKIIFYFIFLIKIYFNLFIFVFVFFLIRILVLFN